jgi:hypothetical protein
MCVRSTCKLIEQRNQIGAQPVDRGGAGRHVGVAMAAAVVADDAKVPS